MHSELTSMFEQQKSEIKDELNHVSEFKQSQEPSSPTKREKEHGLSSESGSSKVYRIPKLNNKLGFRSQISIREIDAKFRRQQTDKVSERSQPTIPIKFVRQTTQQSSVDGFTRENTHNIGRKDKSQSQHSQLSQNDMIYNRSNDKGMSVIEGTDSSSDYTFTNNKNIKLKSGSS